MTKCFTEVWRSEAVVCPKQHESPSTQSYFRSRDYDAMTQHDLQSYNTITIAGVENGDLEQARARERDTLALDQSACQQPCHCSGGAGSECWQEMSWANYTLGWVAMILQRRCSRRLRFATRAMEQPLMRLYLAGIVHSCINTNHSLSDHRQRTSPTASLSIFPY